MRGHLNYRVLLHLVGHIVISYASYSGDKTIFDSDVCFTDAKLFHTWSLTITVGYLSFDFLLLIFIM